MLHSLQYYACCYALLCLLHQQQRAAALTIIIDGATTNEWATRDEYKRMLEASNDLETSLSQQQQQDQQLEQLEQYRPPPPPPPPLPVRQLNERGSSLHKFCGRDLMDALELVCQGRFYVGEAEPQIAEPITKTKRASRLRALPSSSSSSSSFQRQPPSSSPISSLQQQHLPSQISSSSSLSSSSSSSSSLKQPPMIQSDGGVMEDYPAGSSTGGYANGNDQRNNLRLQQQMREIQQLQAELAEAEAAVVAPPHLSGRLREQTITDNNNDGDTISTTIDINPLTSKPRNRYNRMVLSRRVRGATKECCKRSCELDELKAYCEVRP